MIKEILENFNPQDYIGWLILMAASISFLVSYVSYPAIISVAKSKNLMDDSDDRSSHSGKVPNLGGIGMSVSYTHLTLPTKA